ncbi:MAG: TetR/AcrR family transcriptional regulator [Mycobacterium leprae]
MAPRSKDQNEQIRQERRAAILNAAIPLFAANGYSTTSMSEIAQAAGVSHGTVFLYFPTKDLLFRAALEEPLQEAEQHFHLIAAMEGTPLERIRRMVRDQMNVFRNMEDYVRLTQYVIGQRQRFPELAQLCFDFSRRYAETLVPVILEGQRMGQLAKQDPYDIAGIYFSLLNGLALVVLKPHGPIWESAVEAAVRIFAPIEPEGVDPSCR